MEFITSFLLCLSMIFSLLNPFIPITAMAKANDNKDTPVVDTPVNVPQNNTVSENTIEETEEYKIKNFIDLDFEGYCTCAVPLSHFSINNGTTTNVLKNLTYKDKKTKVTMSYITNISKDADIPGYITIDVAGVDTVTNFKEEEIYGDNVKWMKVPSENKEDGCNVYVWYTLNQNKTAAFWVKAKVAPDSDSEEFYEVIKKMFNTYNYYQYGSGTVFDTPNTGYYENAILNNSTIGDTSDFVANTKAFTVFQTRGGYVKDAKISPNWQDLEIIIDGTKFRLPCRLENFYDAGFKINDRSITEKDLEVYPSNQMTLKLINNKGTVVTATVKNESGTDKRSADDCQLVTLLVDRGDFVDIAAADIDDFKDINSDNETSDESEETTDENSTEEATSDENKEASGEENSTEETTKDTEEKETETEESTEEKSTGTGIFDEDTGEEYDEDEIEKVVSIKGNADLLTEISLDTVKKVENKENKETEEATTEESTEESTEGATEESTEDSKEDKKDKDKENSTSDKDEKQVSKDKESHSGLITDDLEFDKDYKKHQVILAGGVTWGVYTDDAIEYYGENVSKIKWNSGEQFKLTWKASEKYMTIIIGELHTIQSVEISCDGLN